LADGVDNFTSAFEAGLRDEGVDFAEVLAGILLGDPFEDVEEETERFALTGASLALFEALSPPDTGLRFCTSFSLGAGYDTRT
jgi:hypothetical protein